MAFFPAFPYLMRFAHLLLPLSYQQAGLLVSWVAALAAAWGVYRIGAQLYGHWAGVIAAMLWGMAPMAVVESMAYSESLFTAFAAWALYCALAGRWPAAGALGLLAGLTRPSGAAVVAALGVAALVELVRRLRARRSGEAVPRSAWWGPVVAAVVAPLGALGYLAWVGRRVHDVTGGYFTVQSKWNSGFDGGVATFHEFETLLGSNRGVPLETVVVAGTVVASLVLFGVTLAQRQPVLLTVYSAMLLVIALGDNGHFMCLGRFLLPAFPLLFPLAAALARIRRTVSGLVLGSGAVLSGLIGGYLLLVWPLWL
jgi:hypothetical protein